MYYPRIDPTSKQSDYIREQLAKLVSQREIARNLSMPRTTLTKHVKRIKEFDLMLKQGQVDEEKEETFTFIPKDDIYGRWERAMKIVTRKNKL